MLLHASLAYLMLLVYILLVYLAFLFYLLFLFFCIPIVFTIIIVFYVLVIDTLFVYFCHSFASCAVLFNEFVFLILSSNCFVYERAMCSLENST